MNKKMSKRQRDMKTKLMAAVCMLLVSSIMMVSTTYAWFTLSTAPEVTGITTAVGANGNLEMALMPTNADFDDQWEALITSGTSDSFDATNQTKVLANVTWGNLVDLQDPSYGLDMISLYPSALNTETKTDGTTGESFSAIAERPLKNPVYGADGRVASLEANTITAGYVSGAFSVEDQPGVRAVGTSSMMSPRELYHREVLSAASTASSTAKNAATSALKTNGDTLASIAIKHAGGDDSNYSKAELEALLAVMESLETAFTQIENGIKNYIAANNIALAANDSNYTAVRNAILDLTLEGIDASDYVHPDNLTTMAARINAAKTSVGTAKETLETKIGQNQDTYVWTDFNTALHAIMDTDKMTLCGIKLTKDELMNNVSDLMGKMSNLTLEMNADSGAFVTVADFCGDYTALITLPPGSNINLSETQSIDLGGAQITMKTQSDVNPAYLTGMNRNKTTFEAATTATTAKSITDFYGYIIDLAFRTNAAGSKLQLQTEGTDRIYGEDGENESVQGSGSTMTFTSASETFSQSSVKALMAALRVVFFEPDTGKILAEARLDTTNTEDAADGSVTAKLYLHNGTTFLKDDASYTDDEADDIADLTQNTAKAISVLVYLDGSAVQNKDVAVDNKSMTGTMNLQFSSSADLTPMNYTDLMNPESESSSTTSVTQLTKAKLESETEAMGVSIYSAGFTTNATAGTTDIGFVLRDTPENATVKVVSIGGTAVDLTAETAIVSGITGYKVTYSGTIEASTEIVISVTAGTDSGSDAGGSGTTTTYDVSVPTGVTGESTATPNTDYTFTVTDGYTLNEVTVGDTTVTPTNNGSGSYTIPGESVTGNIVITVNAASGDDTGE